jgi:NodT family efflux transporter outer membrane factor (OMF) lipoprotein
VRPIAKATRMRTLAALLVLLGGCAVGPDYKRPNVPLNASFRESTDPRLAAQAAVDRAWWTAFHDPTLDQLIELAYHQNLPLQSAGIRILEARAQVGFATGFYWPENPGPIATAQGVGLSDHAANSAGVDHFFGDYKVGFDAIWEIDLWGKYRRGVKGAKASYLATVADYDDALLALAAETARTYFTIRTAQVLLELARENVAVQEDGLHIAESRFRNGATSELDVAQATNLLETTRASIPELMLELARAENALCTLLGRPTGCAQPLLAGPYALPAAPPQVAVSVPAELLRRRPDIRGAELRAVAQCDRIGVAKAELFPKLTLFGSIGTQTSSGGSGASANSSFLNLFGAGSLFYTLGVSLFWPILSYPKILNNVRIQDARFQEALFEYQQTVLRAAQEVDDNIAAFLRQQESAVFAANAAAAAQTAVKLALIQYREGAVDYQRVLDTQRTLLAAQNSLARTRASVATNLVALYKALGGGWELRLGQPVMTNGTRVEMRQRTNWGSYLR